MGRTNSYKKSLGGEDSPLKIGQRLYNKLFSRMDRACNKLPEQLTDKDMTEEEFLEWSKIYSSAKAGYKKGIIIGKEFIKKIWNLRGENVCCILSNFHFRLFLYNKNLAMVVLTIYFIRTSVKVNVF